MNETYPFSLEPLPYAYDALEPHIDEETLHYHHDKHLKTYVDNLNGALQNYPEYQTKTLEWLLMNLESLPEALRTPVRNNGGGVYNHNLYFRGMKKADGMEMSGSLAAAINQTFGSKEQFVTALKQSGLTRFGSGWAFLVKDQEGSLGIISTPNQDTVISMGLKPVLIMDVWEHAYYLKYKNLRTDYIDNWFAVIDWDEAERLYQI